MCNILIGPLAQQVALISFGNEFFSSRKVAHQDTINNSTFQFCNTIIFAKIKRSLLTFKKKENVIAQNPYDWFLLLDKEKCKKLRLFYQSSKDQAFPVHKLAGFVGGGGTWLIEAIYDGYSDYWANKWEVNKPNALDKKIWTVNYLKVFSHQETINLQGKLENEKTNLSITLKEISEFAREQELLYWANIFDKAITSLHSTNPIEEYYHKDLIVDKNYGLIAKQVLFSAGLAWVFGGMGSWNDLGFENKDVNNTYEELSKRLYQNICEAIIYSINSF